MKARNHQQALFARRLMQIVFLVFATQILTTNASAQLVTNTNNAGAGSLRQAILDANANADASTINFSSGVTGTILLLSALPIFEHSVTINGPGANVLSISGDWKYKIFGTVSYGIDFINVSGLTLKLGASTNTGGAISNSSTAALSVSNCIFYQNLAEVSGAAISNDNYGTLTVTNCAFNSNAANYYTTTKFRGGAIYSLGFLSATGCEFQLNRTTNNTKAGEGGAIWMLSGNITNCTFYANSGMGTVGAAIVCTPSAAIAGNTYPATITNCTMSRNEANSDDGTQYYAGGILVNGPAPCSLRNNIIVNYGTRPPVATDIAGAFTSLGNNFIGAVDGGSTGITNGVNGDRAGNIYSPINAVLGIFANYGGLTSTMPLLPGSPCINMGTNTGAPATDQRGVARPAQGTVDIGAFESQGFNISISGGSNQTTPANKTFANPLLVTVSSPFGEPVQNGIITFNAPVSGASILPAYAPVKITTPSGPNSTGSATTGIVSANIYAGGPYTVVANATGVNSLVNFSLTNTRNDPPTCEAGVIQAYISNITAGNQASRGERSIEFIVNNPAGIVIRQLGAFDDGGNGITGTQPDGGIRVAIFNRATKTIVPGLDASVIGMADAYTGNHRMKNITPVNLPPGDYTLVTKGYGAPEFYGDYGTDTLSPYPLGNDGGGAISYGDESGYGPDNPAGFAYPAVAANFGSKHKYLSGTFAFSLPNACAATATLSSLSISQATLSPAFADNITSYTSAVADGVSSVTLTPTSFSTAATIKVNGNTVASSSPVSIPVVPGSNIIEIVITSPDGTVLNTYTINVNKPTGASLPLTLLSFTGTSNRKEAKLLWNTASETKTSYFELQKSSDGIVFSAVARVQAVGAGAGQYHYTDSLGQLPVYYYRLKMVDLNGLFTFSKTIAVNTQADASFSIYPNPAHDWLMINHPAASGKSVIRLMDLNGRLVQVVYPAKNTTQTKMLLQHLAAGMYSAEWQNVSTGTTQRRLVSVQ